MTQTYEQPDQWLKFDGPTFVDPIRNASWIDGSGYTQEHQRRLQSDRQRHAAAVMTTKALIDATPLTTSRHYFQPTPADIKPEFVKRPNVGSRRADGLPHRTDEWTNHEGNDRVDSRPGQFPAVVQFQRDTRDTTSRGDVVRQMYE